MIGDADIARARVQYESDGATVLRGALSRDTIARVAETIDRIMDAGDSGETFSGEGGRFFGDMFSWLRHPTIEALIRDSDLPRLAGELMGARQVRFFYDQILVKEPGSKNRTPWHQDLPYWPVRGEQIVSLWVAIDPATPDNGVVTYVKGSHRWKRFFAMQSFSEDYREEMEREAEATGLYDTTEVAGQWGNLADIRDHPENYDFLAWSVEPGDVLVHHPLTVHGANGNSSQTQRRRAIATRWFGDDARWDAVRPHFMRGLQRRADFPYPDLEQGGDLDAPVFPVVWRRALQPV